MNHFHSNGHSTISCVTLMFIAVCGAQWLRLELVSGTLNVRVHSDVRGALLVHGRIRHNRKPRWRAGSVRHSHANLRMECVEMQATSTEALLLSSSLRVILQQRERADALAFLRIIRASVAMRISCNPLLLDTRPLFAESLRLIDPAYAKVLEERDSQLP